MWWILGILAYLFVGFLFSYFLPASLISMVTGETTDVILWKESPVNAFFIMIFWGALAITTIILGIAILIYVATRIAIGKYFV